MKISITALLICLLILSVSGASFDRQLQASSPVSNYIGVDTPSHSDVKTEELEDAFLVSVFNAEYPNNWRKESLSFTARAKSVSNCSLSIRAPPYKA